MSRYQPYPEYKDSGVEWIGQVPAHWEVRQFWTIVSHRDESGSSSDGLLSVYLDRGVIPYSEGGGLVHKPSESLEKYQLVLPGDLVMNNQQAWRGSVGVSKYRGIVSPAYLVFCIDNALLEPSFAAFALRDRVYIEKIMLCSLSVGTIQRQVKWPYLRKLPVLLPPVSEQSDIATFLDRETTRIDTLIEKKQRFIELLEEKRQAVITHAVTKGLDPDVPMKDSGVEWIGEVPAHWEVKKLKHAGAIVSGGTPKSGEPKFWDENGVEWFTPADLSEGVVTLLGSSRRRLSAEGIHSCGADESPAGSIVVSIRAPVGNIGMLSEPGATNQGCKTLVPREIGRSTIIASALSVATDYLQAEANGTTFHELSGTSLGAFPVPWPPIQESNAIATFLDRETTRIDTLISKTRESIDLLKERRSALITAAVTGKIDVREESA